MERIVGLKGYTIWKQYRSVLGLPGQVTEEYRILIQGGYNRNYLFTHPVIGRKLVPRINCGSQMRLEHQIQYEYEMPKLLQQSGKTPWPSCADGNLEKTSHGTMMMGFLPDHAMDCRTELSFGVECLADIHSVRVGNGSHLVRPEDPLEAILTECEVMVGTYMDSDLGDQGIKMKIRQMLNRGWKRCREAATCKGYECCINTEFNSINFLINGEGKGNYLANWERPIYGEPAQDLGHLLVPAITFWKIDVILIPEKVEDFIHLYIQKVDGGFDTKGLMERTLAYIPITCLHGIIWCVTAWVQYQQPDKLLFNQSTFQKLGQYLDMESLEKTDRLQEGNMNGEKRSKQIWKAMVAACIAASTLSYMCMSSVKNMTNKIVAMFAAGLMILFTLSTFVVMIRKVYRKTRKNEEEEIKKKFVTLGVMMVLSMIVAAGCDQKAGSEIAAQETTENTTVDIAVANTTTVDTAAADTTGADGVRNEAMAALRSDGSYQYISLKKVVAAAKDKSVHVLDVREWDNYVKGKVADSIQCPISPLEGDSLVGAMGTYAKENLSNGQKIYIIYNSGKRGAEKATGALKEAGIDGSLIYTVEGGAKVLESKKGVLTTSRVEEDIDWKTVVAVDVSKAVGGSDVQILNVQDNDTYVEGHLKGSPQNSLKEIRDPAVQTVMYKMTKEEMDPFKPIYLLCYSGNKCAKADISVMKDVEFDVDNLFIIENSTKDKDIQAAFVIEQDNPSGDAVSPVRTV